MKIVPLAADSLGVRSMATYVEAGRTGLLIDPGATLAPSRYGLPPAEMRVAFGIVNVGGTPAVAETFGIAETTVKTHLKSIFQKTGASRQADLVKLVAALASPLAAD